MGRASGVWGVVLPGGERPNRIGPDPLSRVGHPEGRRRGSLAGAASRLIPDDRLVLVETRDAQEGDSDWTQFPRAHRLVQPVARGSAPSVYLALLRIARFDPDATVVVLPGDHRVDDGDRFLHHIRRALWGTARRPDLPIVLGAHAVLPDASYGWIEAGDLIEGLESLSIRAVRRFVEEPWRRASIASGP
jgi:mannose-1-phosphate guanylyltransferase